MCRMKVIDYQQETSERSPMQGLPRTKRDSSLDRWVGIAERCRWGKCSQRQKGSCISYLSVTYCCVTKYPYLSGLKHCWFAYSSIGQRFGLGSAGVSHVATVIWQFDWGWMVSDGFTSGSGAGCQWVSFSVHLMASHPPEDRTEFLYIMAEVFQEDETRRYKTSWSENPEVTQCVSSATCWLNQVSD